MAEEVTENCAQNEDNAAHRGRSALRVVRLRAVVANELAPLQVLEKPNETWGGKQRDK